MANAFNPLTWNVPIVNLKDGTPTRQFMQILQNALRAVDDNTGTLEDVFDAPIVMTGDPGPEFTADSVLTEGAGIDITVGSGLATVSLENTTVTPASYGDSSHVGAFTVDQKGRLTAASSVAISPVAIGGVPATRTLTAGSGLTGGGDLSADRTFTVGAGSGITVNADDVAVTDTAVTPASYGSASAVPTYTVNSRGQLTAAANVNIAVDATAITSGTLPVARGGTDISSYAVGDLIYASGATTLSKLADVATGNALISGGVTTAPSWGKIALTTHISGVLPAANGGTGVNNTGTITLGGNFITSGAFAATLTLTATTNVTLPTTGTLATLAGTETLTNKTVVGYVPDARTITAGNGLTGGGDLSANRTLDIGAGAGITVNANDVALTVPTASGTYTPTLTGVTNVGSSTSFVCMYTRVGDVVEVSGVANIDPTALGTTILAVSLPIASNLGAFNDCLGTGSSANASASSLAVYGDDTNDRALLQFVATDINVWTWFFKFGYRII